MSQYQESKRPNKMEIISVFQVFRFDCSIDLIRYFSSFFGFFFKICEPILLNLKMFGFIELSVFLKLQIFYDFFLNSNRKWIKITVGFQLRWWCRYGTSSVCIFYWLNKSNILCHMQQKVYDFSFYAAVHSWENSVINS